VHFFPFTIFALMASWPPWQIAANNCTKALEIKPDHPKALYRRGQAQAQLGELTAAKEDLERALELSGGDAAVAAELEAVKQRMAAAKEKEKKMFSKMFT
jgi:regulator of sirC expression with transglutaminase-like and TPR domain